jgi:pimeloyl-ACP methyl ester carboxylesterase
MNSAKIQINGKSLSYSVSGKGKPVVLLHGYLESKELWEDIASVLSSKYFVICPDLPGQGDSEPHEQQTIESMAESVSKLLDYLKIDKIYLFGHSMGGYVSLAFTELFQQKLLGIGLLHSHPFKDSDEKQKQRSQEIELVKNGKRELIIKSSVPNYFASEFAEKNKEIVEKSNNMAMKTKDEGMIACISAMMKRKDRLDVLKKCQIPVLLIAGRKDKLIPCDKAIETAKEIENIQFEILEKSGHVGMVEELNETINILTRFLQTS